MGYQIFRPSPNRILSKNDEDITWCNQELPRTMEIIRSFNTNYRHVSKCREWESPKFLGVNMEDTNQYLDMFGATFPVFSSRNP
jgi:hypothetical protein